MQGGCKSTLKYCLQLSKMQKNCRNECNFRSASFESYKLRCFHLDKFFFVELTKVKNL